MSIQELNHRIREALIRALKDGNFESVGDALLKALSEEGYHER